MMRRGQVLVRAQFDDGTFGNADALDLDEESFRAFVLDRLKMAGLVYALKDTADIPMGDEVRYRVKPGIKE